MITAQPTHLGRVVHLARQFGIKEPHELLERHARLAWLALVRGRGGRARADVIKEIVIGHRDGCVAVRIVKGAFLAVRLG